MTIKSKVLATAAALALAGGLGTAGVLGTAGTAAAATPSCGASCVNTYPEEFSGPTLDSPTFTLDVYQRKARAGQPVILFKASNADPAEDFTYADEGNVSDFFAAGLVDSAVDLHYGCTGGSIILIAGTLGTCAAGAVDETAFQLEYSPYGVDSGLCAGLAATAAGGEDVTLQDCGVTAKTIWIEDTYYGDYTAVGAPSPSATPVTPSSPLPFPTGTTTPTPVPVPTATSDTGDYVVLVNGSDTDFSQPFVLTYPGTAYPTDYYPSANPHRPELQVDNLAQFSNGTPADATNQLWDQFTGVLP